VRFVVDLAAGGQWLEIVPALRFVEDQLLYFIAHAWRQGEQRKSADTLGSLARARDLAATISPVR
jgi:hypothetical protein